MTANDYYDWKRHPVTLEVLREFERRYETLKEELVEQASSIPHTELAEKAGGAKAYRDVLSITFDEIHNEESHGD